MRSGRRWGKEGGIGSSITKPDRIGQKETGRGELVLGDRKMILFVVHWSRTQNHNGAGGGMIALFCLCRSYT